MFNFTFLILTLILLASAQTNIRIKSPSSLIKTLDKMYQNNIENEGYKNNNPIAIKRNFVGGNGKVKYSVSMFGDINYLQKTIFTVITPPDIEACEPLDIVTEKAINDSLTYVKNNQEPNTNSPLEHKSTATKTAYLVERGICPYSQKVNNLRLAGADLVIVYHNDPNVDVD